MVLDPALLNTQHYKVGIKSKVEQSREWSCALPYTWVLQLYKREPSGHPRQRSPTLLTYIYIYICILSSTDRLFRCITTLQCGQTRRTLEARIETRPNFTLDLVSYRSANKRTTSTRELLGIKQQLSFVYILYLTGYQSAQFVRRA